MSLNAVRRRVADAHAHHHVLAPELQRPFLAAGHKEAAVLLIGQREAGTVEAVDGLVEPGRRRIDGRRRVREGRQHPNAHRHQRRERRTCRTHAAPPRRIPLTPDPSPPKRGRGKKGYARRTD